MQKHDLTDITLPDADKEAPADLNLNINEGDEGVAADKGVDEKEQNETKPAETVSKDESGETGTPDAGSKPPEDVSTGKDETKPDTETKPPADEADESKKKEEPLTPFHEHPDWKKMQERLERVEQENADLKAVKETPKETEENQKSLQDQAREIVRKKIDEGWTPKDQVEISLEVNGVYTELLQKENKLEEQKKIKEADALEDRRKEVAKQVDDTLDKLELKSESDREKVIDQVNKWKDKGMTVSVATLEIAADYLKTKGELGEKPAAPEKTQEEQKKEDVNRKISRPSSSGDKTNTKAKNSYKEMHGTTLDDIIIREAQKLGS